MENNNNFDWGGGTIFLVILVIGLIVAGAGHSEYCNQSPNNCEVTNTR